MPAKELQQTPSPRAAFSGAPGAREAPSDPDLAVVVDAWPRLPEAVKTKIIELVRAADPEA